MIYVLLNCWLFTLLQKSCFCCFVAVSFAINLEVGHGPGLYGPIELLRAPSAKAAATRRNRKFSDPRRRSCFIEMKEKIRQTNMVEIEVFDLLGGGFTQHHFGMILQGGKSSALLRLDGPRLFFPYGLTIFRPFWGGPLGQTPKLRFSQDIKKASQAYGQTGSANWINIEEG